MSAINTRGRHFKKEIILMAVRWYVTYSLSYRNIEELLAERGLSVDHTTVYCWMVAYTSELEANFRRKKKSVATSWRMDETYIKVKGIWHYLYRALDKYGDTIDSLFRCFLLMSTAFKRADFRRFLQLFEFSDGSCRLYK